MKNKNLQVYKVESSPDSPSVVMLHGYGANGRDLVGLAHYGPLAKLNLNWYFLEAPLSPPELALFGGRAWFNITVSSFGPNMSPETLEKFYALENKEYQKSLELVNAAIWNLNLNSPPVIGGFSQGAMMAANSFMQDVESYKGLVALSGVPLRHHTWPQATTLKKVFVSHGEQDSVLPFQAGQDLAQKLKEKNYEVEKAWFQGGHEIPPVVLNRLSDFLSGLT